MQNLTKLRYTIHLKIYVLDKIQSIALIIGKYSQAQIRRIIYELRIIQNLITVFTPQIEVSKTNNNNYVLVCKISLYATIFKINSYW